VLIRPSDREVEHHDAFKVRDDDQLDALVLGVREVGVAALGRVKGHDETMREAVVQAFIALIHAMLHREEPGNLADHAAHLRETMIDGRRADALLENKCAVVEDHFTRGWGMGDK